MFLFSRHILSLEFFKGFFVSGGTGYLQCVEFDGLGEKSAFTNGSNVADLDIPEKIRHKLTSFDLKDAYPRVV